MQNTLREKIIEILILFKAGKLTDEEEFADQILFLIIEELPKKERISLSSEEKSGYDFCLQELIEMLKGV